MTPFLLAQPRVSGAPSAGNNLQACAIVFVISIVAATFQITHWVHPTMGFGHEDVDVARSLAATGSFADPFGSHTGPTAHVAPLYPLLLAGLLKSAGAGDLAGHIMVWLTILAYAGCAVLLVLVSNVLFHDAVPGILGALLVNCVPQFRMDPAWETTCISAGVLALILLLAHLRETGARLFWKLALAGAFAGMLVLMNPAVILIVLPALVVLYGSQVKVWGVFLTVMFLVCLPWTIRNYRVFHAFFFVRDNLGLELYVSNNDCEASRIWNAGCPAHPTASRAETEAVREMGELNYNRDRMAKATAWISTHRAAFLQLVFERFAGFWFPLSGYAPPPFSFGVCCTTLLSLPGLAWMYRRRRDAAWLMFAVAAAYPWLYCLVRSDIRYRYPILWVSLLPAGYFLAQLAPLVRKWRRSEVLSPAIR